MVTQREFRKSQGVVPFGVGAIIDFENESLMSAGLDVWPFEKAEGEARAAILNASQVLDGRLARRLSAELNRRVDFFLSPAEAPERVSFRGGPQLDKAFMPFVRFPRWYFCPRCRVLKNIPWNAQSGSEILRCTNLGRRVEGKGEPCGKLHKNRRPFLSPVRFVVACANGHIMDFPWHQWAHRKSKSDCEGGPDSLYLYSTPAAGLSGVVVGCVRCKSSNSLAGAFQRDALRDVYSSGCPGERPWLGSGGAHQCSGSLIPQTVQRGASNAYFARVVSSILIPPYSARLQQVLDRPDIWAEIEAIPLVDGKPFEEFLRVKAKNLGLDADAFIQAVSERRNARFGAEVVEQISEERYRADEYRAYTGPRPPKQERHDFDTEDIPLSKYPTWCSKFFDKIVLIKKLRETRVLTGFSRLVPPEIADSELAALSLHPKNWLPGFSVRGEGIFLRFNRSSLKEWSEKDEIRRRTALLQSRLNKVRSERSLEDREITAELILIHTFSHLVIRQLAFECGYDSSSIRERLYASLPTTSDHMAGLLLYTASGDSEGTLGGLVRQGEPGNLDQTIKAALVNGSICSSDPLCSESEGQGNNSLNLACCHACGLLPETSCEEGNLLLDRVMVLGTASQPEIGFFGEDFE